jgi:hypothetical protein
MEEGQYAGAQGRNMAVGCVGAPNMGRETTM